MEPQGIAVEQRTADIYIVDSNNYRVEKFTGGGVFLYAWGWGVADGRTEAEQRCTTQCHAGLRGEGPGQLGFTEGVAVDNDPASSSYGDVYIVDIGNLRVEKFNPSGEFLLMFGGGVNATAVQRAETANRGICPVDPGDRCQAGSKGGADGQFSFRSEGDFVSVGPDGRVYVGDTNRVQEFTSSGAFVRQLRLPPPKVVEGPEVGGIPGLVVDAAGNLYVVRNGIGGVSKYTPAGELLYTLDDQELESTEGPTPTMALDALGNIFIDERAQTWHRIVEYDASGIEVASFDAGMEDGLHGLAFGDRLKRLYVVNTNNNVSPLVARVRIVAPPSPEPLAVCGCRRATGF
jgi:tripartite motif-containing protein 71